MHRFLSSSARRASIVGSCALLVAGCASNPVSVVEQDKGAELLKVRINAIADGELSVHTRQTLRVLDLMDAWEADGADVLPRLRLDHPGAAPDWERALAYAEICYFLGREADTPTLARSYFLDTTLVAIEGLREVAGLGSVFDPKQQLLAELYNFGLANLVEIGQGFKGPAEEWLDLGDASSRSIRIASGPGMIDPALYERFIPVQSIVEEGLPNEHGRYGIGAPLVAYRSNLKGQTRIDPLYGPSICRPVTLVLVPLGEDTLELRFYDAFRVSEMMTANGGILPLASDFTAPLGYAISLSDTYTKETSSLLDPESFVAFEGLYLAEPYDPDKIPVVLVHGLWSSPLTWIWVLNEIWGDDTLRSAYQVWFYAYPTGFPVMFNASQLRKRLLETRQKVDPEGRNPASEGLVIIGHSMGGLLTKFMVKETGDRLWNIRFTKPFDEVKWSNQKDREMVREAAFFSPLPFVDCVVFMATPHLGSEDADGLLGSLGSSMITLPDYMDSMAPRLIADNPGIMREAEGLDADASMNSIDHLSTHSPLLKELDAIPYPPDLPVYVIIGDEERAGRKGGTDGVVPYWSSRQDGARSELVVHSDHSVTKNPSAILEVRRILREHLAATRNP